MSEFSCLDVAKAAKLDEGRHSGSERLFRCPHHDDARPSLSVNEVKDVWMCGPCDEAGKAWQLAAFIGGHGPQETPAMLAWLQEHGLLNGRRKFVATHDYHSEDGEPLYQVVRFEPKDFRQRRPDGNGGWIWNLNGARRVPYRLPEVLAATEVFIVEGEKDADNLVMLGFVATTNPGGAGKWKKEYAEYFSAEQHVVILYDNDDAGLKHARKVAGLLAEVVASIKILDLPVREKGDVSDWIADQSDAETAAERLSIMAEEAEEWRLPPRGQQEAEADQRQDDVAVRPTIEIRSDLTGITDEAIAALAARPELGVYVRGRQLVRVARDGSPPERWLTRWPGSTVIVPLDTARVLAVLDRAARWVKYDGRRKDYVPAIPPSWAAKQVASRLDWKLPYLEAVTETPTIREDGSILNSPGFDEPTGLLYTPIPGGEDWPRTPETPTGKDIENAVATLADPVAEFPWVDESDMAAAIAAVLTLLARHLIHGPVPLFAVRAPTPGTGKTLLADLIGFIGTGRVPPAMPMTYEAEELRKRITSLAVEGAQIILLDNVSGTLGSDTLAAALTATDWEDRILGTNTVVRVPLRVVWLATGNNLGFRRTLGRRVIPIDLDARIEQPEDRTGFRYPNLKLRVQECRPKLVAAALTILRAFHIAGRPTHGGRRMGSFEAWDDLIRSVIIWAGLDDPATIDPTKGRGRVRSQADDDTETLGALLQALVGQWQDAAFTTADVIAGTAKNDDLRTAVDLAASPARGGKPTTRSLGYALRTACDRPVGGLALRRWKTGRGGVLWRVETLE